MRGILTLVRTRWDYKKIICKNESVSSVATKTLIFAHYLLWSHLVLMRINTASEK